MSKHHSHLIRGVPNNWATRLTVRIVNAALARSESRYRVYPRYRGPKTRGARGLRPDLRRAEARYFALYLRDLRPPYRPTNEVWRDHGPVHVHERPTVLIRADGPEAH